MGRRAERRANPSVASRQDLGCVFVETRVVSTRCRDLVPRSAGACSTFASPRPVSSLAQYEWFRGSSLALLAPQPPLVKGGLVWYPRQDSNLRFRLRRAALYPLSYGGPDAASQTLPGRVVRPEIWGSETGSECVVARR